ncbi:PREDICTED: olfactory receptor 6M1-like [Gekko japonicus]|uniref:Olfactory receptor n=1 Tax=Gekko japonicus TaxID=146911 RepID=A0ABM1KNN7_GEKJA|nr:PREDICTED: olfactory receptor 6M1-like [Gekko japonicus]
MQSKNHSTLEEFILLGIRFPDHLLILFFCLLLLTFTLTLLGNLIIVAVILLDVRLHSPMYFFLFNLSILEIAFTSSIIPIMLSNLLSRTKTISFYGCLTQCFFYFFLGVAEFLLLAIMSFDRYVAICNPLHYVSIMNFRICSWLVFFCWVTAFVLVIGPVIAISMLPFCGSNVINHLFCDSEPLLELSCGSIRLIEFFNFINAIIVLLGSLILTTVSYVSIISTVLRIPSASGRQKAFSTCGAHITVASIYYGSAIFMYLRPSKTPSLDLKKAVSILTAVITPLLNPFIYTLRNEKVKEALRDLLKGRLHLNAHV